MAKPKKPARPAGRGELDAVRVFASVVRAQSFRGAAQLLGVPKSTVSAQIARLEERLETRLLARTTRVVRLTEAGEQYYEKIAPAIDALLEAERSLGASHAEPTGRLRITAPMELGQAIFGEALGEYMRRHPSVEVVAELVDRHIDLVKEGFDLGLRGGPLPDSSLVARKLGPPGSPVIVASPRYLAGRKPPKRPQDLREHDCLVMSPRRGPTTWTFQKGSRSIQVEIRPRLHVNSFIVVRDLALAGLGIAWIPSRACGAELESGELVALLQDYTLPQTQLYAVYPGEGSVSPKLRSILEIVERTLASAKLRRVR